MLVKKKFAKSFVRASQKACLIALFFAVKTSVFASLQYGIEAGLEQTSYLTEASEASRLGEYTDFDGTFKFVDRSDETVFKLDGEIHQSLSGSADNLIAIPEFFYTWSLGKKQSLTVGRKVHVWSRGDDLWAVGFFQPALRLDSIQPVPMGLTGFWWEAYGNDFMFTALLSPFFLPDQGPAIREKNGELTSNNPWFDSPVSQLRLASLESDIRYKIKWPLPDDIFQNNSYLIQLKWGILKDYQDGSWLRLSIADKPLNQLVLGLKGVQKLGVTDGQYTEAEINPYVVRHRILSTEVGWQKGTWTLFASTSIDKPYEQIGGMVVNRPTPNQAVFVGAETSAVLAGFKTQHLLSGVNIWEKKATRSAQDSSEITAGLGEFERFQFTQAVMWSSSVRLGNDDDQMGFRYIYSLVERGGLLSAFIDYNLEQNFRISLSMDVLGTQDENANGNPGFISKHKENDRAQARLTYVF